MTRERLERIVATTRESVARRGAVFSDADCQRAVDAGMQADDDGPHAWAAAVEQVLMEAWA